jgi:hypothetical protein
MISQITKYGGIGMLKLSISPHKPLIVLDNKIRFTFGGELWFIVATNPVFLDLVYPLPSPRLSDFTRQAANRTG